MLECWVGSGSTVFGSHDARRRANDQITAEGNVQSAWMVRATLVS